MIEKNIKIKYKDLLASWLVIEKIMKKEVPFGLQYWLKRNIDRIGKNIKDLEMERISLCEKYKEFRKEDGKIENEEFKEKMKEILEKELEITFFPIEIKLFGNINLTAMDIKLIEYMICEDRMIKVLNS